MIRLLVVFAALLAASAFAESAKIARDVPCDSAGIELVSPKGDCVVETLTDAQRKVMALPTLEERIGLFRGDREGKKKLQHDSLWRKAAPVVLRWRAPDGVKGPWKIEIAKSADLSDAQLWYARNDKPGRAARPWL